MSYLNTVPLVWGMLHGEQKGMFELVFRVPAECADMLSAGEVDIGILPVYELAGKPFQTVPGLGIACRGEVRSIRLVSKVPVGAIRTLAADASSRTSVQLARVVLERRYGVRPAVRRHAPDLPAMLEAADAALLIGDPALRIVPEELPYKVYDLGAEWLSMTGLPMVFAMWAGRAEAITPEVVEAFHSSWRFGMERMEEIAAGESGRRGFSPGLVREYLTSNIRHRLGEEEERGMQLFLEYAAAASGASSGTSGS